MLIIRTRSSVPPPNVRGSTAISHDDMPLLSTLAVDASDDSELGVASTTTKRSSPFGGGATRVGSLAMRVFVVSFLLWIRPTDCSWIFSGIPPQELDEARDIGRKGERKLMKNKKEVKDRNRQKPQLDVLLRLQWDASEWQMIAANIDVVRNSFYLDGLEQCNDIDRNWTDHIQTEALRYGNVENAVWLEKAGMKEFTSLFMTLPP
ncbi:unnamed protein product, partial [Strongylus vulgaris]